MSRARVVVVTTIVLAFFSLAVLTLFVLVSLVSPDKGSPDILPGRAKIGLVRISGVIEDVGETVREIDTYRESSSIKGLVVRVDSPGGGVGASREIYESLLRVREDGKPVIVSMGSIAASGGYYVALGADSIFAGSSTLTGSIGVIATFANVKRALDKLGIEFEILATGPFKASGSEFKPMTDEERRYLQALLDDFFQQFVDAIAESRGMDRDSVLAIADGRAFTGRQAVELGLVDRIATLEEAQDVAAIMAGLPTPAKVVERKERPLVNLRDLLRDARLAFGQMPTLAPRIEYRMF